MIREVVKPANQLTLPETELQEEVTRMLLAANPAGALHQPVRWSLQERAWKPETGTDPVRCSPQGGPFHDTSYGVP